MPYYRRVGEIPPKRHTQFRAPDGRLYAEELMGTEGFSSSSALLYHRDPPTALVAAEAVPEPDVGLRPNEPLLPRHLRTADLPSGGDLVTGRRVLLANDDVRLAVAGPTAPSGLYRNATGDEIVYLRTGTARLESSFGTLDCRAGDYVVVPTGTTHRWVPTGGAGAEPVAALVIEARGHVGPPERYLSATGQFLEHSPYCERDLHAPTGPHVVEDEGPTDGPTDGAGGFEVLVRQRAGLTRYHYAHHPFDVVGWDGCLYPYRLSIHDFEPITGRVHQPPPVHQTFAGPRFVVCSFVPRKLDYHPLGGADALQPRQRRQRRGAVLLLGRLHQPQGRGHRGRLDEPAPGRVRPRAPAGQRRGVARRRGDRRAGGDGRHVRAPGAGGRGRGCEDADYAWTWASSVRG